MKDRAKLRILHVTPFYPPSIGGISNLVFNVCKGLSKLDIDISIITSRNIFDGISYEERNFDNIIEIKSIHFPGWPYSTLKNFSFPADLGLKVKSIIRKESFDVVHVHGHHYPLCWIALDAAHKMNIPTVLSVHGTYALNPKKLGGSSAIEDIFNKHLFRNILQKSDFVIGGTNRIIEHARRFSLPNARFRIVPNGVDSKRFRLNLGRREQYREKLKLSQTKTVILFVGRFDESKGALNFAKAAHMLLSKHGDKFEAIMVGQGNQETEIKSMADSIKGFHILNWQPAENIHEIYLAADLFILPSKFEGLPLTIIEAMAAGLYIIYSNVGGVDDILQGYPKKMMLRDISTEEIESACLTFFDSVDIGIEQYSSSYEFNFDWENISRMIHAVYNEIMLTRTEG